MQIMKQQVSYFSLFKQKLIMKVKASENCQKKSLLFVILLVK